MENIIFLDIDGVLNDNNSRFSLKSIQTLKQLINTYNAKIVIISSWQSNGTTNRRNIIMDEFKQYEISNIDFIVPNFEGDFCGITIPSRIIDIVDYLKK